ncbi:hypothetical protein [Bacillus atrophaeus]|uniref:hypothetical protein n=1 Tax=Bacillus atrophaeus TaxID=1452 RepID=UPI000B92571B|nr:hypothetical protein [Bacillus atrophaeus]ASS70102.1 hypothetical protein BaGK_03550 [Bacillus atrophaeus]MCY9166029.1 hypothetical protein [Bacillus atrophaeus]
MNVVITMSNKDSFRLTDFENMEAVEEFIDDLHDEVDGKRVLKNRLIDLVEPVLINPTQIAHIEIEESEGKSH